MDKKLVIVVLIERKVFCAVAPNRPHPWRRVAGICDEIRVFRMKLGMDNRLIWRGVDNLAAAAICSSDGDMRFVVAFHRCYDKLLIRTDAAFAETSAGELCKHTFLKSVEMDCFYGIRLCIKEFGAVFGNHAGVAVNLIGICQLHNIAVGKFQFEKIRFS